MKAIILAAGIGKRMHSNLQKVLHPILGKTIIQYVIESAFSAGIEDITVVVGKDGDEISTQLGQIYPQLHFAIQDQPLGTGHAVLAGMSQISDDDDVLILYGDMPLITGEFMSDLKTFHIKNNTDAIVTAAYSPNLGDFGRVFADDNGFFIEIIEHKDVTPNTPVTEWINTGPYVFKGGALRKGLAKMGNNNSQGEYYLTDVPKILREDGCNARVFQSREDLSIFTGINTQVHLADAVGHMKSRINRHHMLNGVRMIDPATVFIDDTVKIEPGVVIYPGAILEGSCKIGPGAMIGPGSHLQNAIVGKGAHIRQSVIMDATIGDHAVVGPFAYLRPHAVIGEKSKIGCFVEVKNSNIANNSKVNHLAYIGDADIGSGVNIGCGVITANYDGRNKHRTTIEDGVFVGCNSNLVAPVTLGKNSFVATGSTITKDLSDSALGIARARQEEKLNWSRP